MDYLQSMKNESDVSCSSLFLLSSSIKSEDWVRPGAKRLLDQLDNPEEFLRRLPTLPLPEWSIRGGRSMLMERMETVGGHSVLGSGVNVEQFGHGFEENMEHLRKMFYSTKLEINRW